MNASEVELREIIERSERRAVMAGIAVVAGVIFELVLAFAANEPLSFKVGVGLADAIVALGVAAELFFGKRTTSAQAELQRRAELALADSTRKAGEANDRAAQALLEAERLRAVAAWRTLSEEQYKGLARAIRDSGEGASIRFTVLVNDYESLHLAQQISIPFKIAGWKVGYRFEAYTHGVMTGILLPEPHDNWLDEIRGLSERVRAAFIAADIRFANGWPLRAYMSTDSADALGAPIASIYVGPKPMPNL